MYSIKGPACFRVLNVCLEDLGSDHHATHIPSSQALCCCLLDVGKVFVAWVIFTCGFNFTSWRSQRWWRHCIICHLLMTYNSKTPLIFPRTKNSKTVCVIVFHLESKPNGGCKSEMGCEMERVAQQRTVWLREWSKIFLLRSYVSQWFNLCYCIHCLPKLLYKLLLFIIIIRSYNAKLFFHL